MEAQNGFCHATEEKEEREEKEEISQTGPTEPQTSSVTGSRWLNGQCVLAMPSSSMWNPSFDFPQCRALLERSGFQIPASDFEAPLRAALDVPSVRRYMVFNSALFHFIMAPVLYLAVWCSAFSTLRIYITVGDYWVLCLCVSLVSIFITTAIIFVLHHSNKEINMNLDVRLIQVNERLEKHRLLVAVADWVQNCSGNMQLYLVYWDMSRCLKSLTEALEEHSFMPSDVQNKLKNKLSHLILVTEVPVAAGGGGGEDDVERASPEQRPLLGSEDTDRPSSSGGLGGAKVTVNRSLVPEASLPAQAKARRLLMTYSAAYARLLVSRRLSGPSNYRLRPRRNHCAAAPLCLCQYIKTKVLR